MLSLGIRKFVSLQPTDGMGQAPLVGPKERIRDRLQAWKELGRGHRVGSLVLTGATTEALRVVAEAVF